MQGILGYAPPGVTSMPETTMEMAEAAVYYAVITVHGEMPEELTDIEFMAQPDGYETAEIPVETAGPSLTPDLRSYTAAKSAEKPSWSIIRKKNENRLFPVRRQAVIF